MAENQKSVPGWCFSFPDPEEGVECLMCGGQERPSIRGGRWPVGICEACSVHLYWHWRRMPPDNDPRVLDENSLRVRVAKVLIVHLTKLSSGDPADPEASESYEVGLVTRSDGQLDLPSAELASNETVATGALRALRERGIVSWPCFLEPLYAALAPRGRLVQVMLATAHTTWERDPRGGTQTASIDKKYGDESCWGLQWHPWGPWERVPDLASLYIALRDVWPLRLWKYRGQKTRTAEICTFVRRAAAEYIYLQQDLRDPKKMNQVDATGAEILRRSMSEDEKLVARLISEREKGEDERREQAAAEAARTKEVAKKATEDGVSAPVSSFHDEAPPGSSIGDDGGGDDDLEASFSGEPGGGES